jgi:hypothetical protein
VPGRAIVLSKPLAVRPSCHARISFNIASPRGAELIVEHRNGDQLLARECRPVPPRTCVSEIKTHPEASHIACLLQARGVPIEGVRFALDCGDPIQPTGRNFIVIGAMKAGTTSLFAMLARHPALCQTWAHTPGMSFPKEINYFFRLYRKSDTPLHYDWRFPFDPSRHAWTLDVSPNYAKYPGSKAVPARIASLGGETKLAYILREPIDRIESQIAHTLQHERTANLPHCIRTSRYALQLDKFMTYFERDDILLLDFEQLRQDPAGILARICDFLAIERIAPRRRKIHNRRDFDYRLDLTQRAEFAEALRPDVQRLISVYGFTPAESWLQS